MKPKGRDRESRFGRGDVTIERHETVFQGYFRVDRYTLRHRLFRGGWSRPIQREVFERGHAVAVLPYDPVLDAVVLIEQFRAGPLAAGDQPWVIETIAGIVEDDESADAVARREAHEEAGLEFAALTRIADYYASPGGASERIQVYCGHADLAGAGGIHGRTDEDEDIRVLVLSRDAALEALAAGRVRASPAIVGLQWLALNHARLRARWAPNGRRRRLDLPRRRAPR